MPKPLRGSSSLLRGIVVSHRDQTSQYPTWRGDPFDVLPLHQLKFHIGIEMVLKLARGMIHVGDRIPLGQRQTNHSLNGGRGIRQPARQVIEMRETENVHML